MFCSPAAVPVYLCAKCLCKHAAHISTVYTRQRSSACLAFTFNRHSSYFRRLFQRHSNLLPRVAGPTINLLYALFYLHCPVFVVTVFIFAAVNQSSEWTLRCCREKKTGGTLFFLRRNEAVPRLNSILMLCVDWRRRGIPRAITLRCWFTKKSFRSLRPPLIKQRLFFHSSVIMKRALRLLAWNKLKTSQQGLYLSCLPLILTLVKKCLRCVALRGIRCSLSLHGKQTFFDSWGESVLGVIFFCN